MKFVILDEVDYMTKNAQQALRYLLQNYSNGVRFCLICNYISKIDEGLQNDFLKLRFNQLPENDIFLFLNNIVQNEGLHLNETSVRLIQQLFKSDIRSMINFMQTNQNIQYNHIHIIEPNVWETLLTMILKEDSAHLLNHIHEISINYNIDKKNIMKDFLNYIIRKKQHIVTTPFLNFIENVIHFEDCSNEDYVNYTIIKIKKYLNQS
jgi:DNA polymerase III delta prime subunit